MSFEKLYRPSVSSHSLQCATYASKWQRDKFSRTGNYHRSTTLRLGRQRQVWLIPIADERVGVQVKLWDPLRTRVIPKRFCGGLSLRRGAIPSVCTFTFNSRTSTSTSTSTSTVQVPGRDWVCTMTMKLKVILLYPVARRLNRYMHRQKQLKHRQVKWFNNNIYTYNEMRVTIEDGMYSLVIEVKI